MACEHEADLQRLLLELPRCDERIGKLEARMTAWEEEARVQARAKELVQAGKSDAQVASEKRRDAVLAVAMLLMPVVTALLNKVIK